MTLCHICVLAAPGSGHTRPNISVATYLLQDPTIEPYVTLVLPVDSTSQNLSENFALVNIPRFRIIALHLPGPFPDNNYMREHLDSHKEEAVSRLIPQLHNDPDFPPITAIVCDMFAVLWARLLTDILSVPNFVLFPSPLTFAWYAQHYREIIALREEKRKDPVMIPGFKMQFELSDFVDGAPYMMHRIYEYCDNFEYADGFLCQDSLDMYHDKLTLKNHIIQNFQEARIKAGLMPKKLEIYMTGALCLHSMDALATIIPNPYPTYSAPMDWLHKQKPRSVVFIALGSWCRISDSDVAALASALDAMDRPFLWAYRPKKTDTRPHGCKEQSSPEHSAPDGLPLGFREKFVDRSRGFISDWVDQAAVLQHPSTACFVTHCGWNSLTEATALGGIPLVLLPIAAEQGVNSVVVEKEWQTGLRLWNMNPNRKLLRHEIVSKINTVLEHPKFSQNARYCKQKFHSATVDSNGEAVRDRRLFLQHVLMN